MINHLCFDVLNGHDHWLPLILNTGNPVNTLIFDAIAPGGDIRVTFSPTNTQSTYQTNIPVYNLAIGGCCNSSSYIRRTNNSRATKVVESTAVECRAENNRCTYWFGFDSKSGWVSFGKGADTSLSKALLKWQDPSPLENLKYVGLSNYNYKINYYDIRLANTASSPPFPRRLLPLFITGEDLVRSAFPNISQMSPPQLSQARLLAAWLKASNTQRQLELCSGNVAQPETVISVFNALMESFGIKAGITEGSNDDSYLKQRYLGGLEFANQAMRLSFSTSSIFAMESQDQLSSSANEIELNLLGNMQMIPIGSSQRQLFVECFEQDLASAIGIHPNAVLIKEITSNTAELTVVVLITADPVSQKSGSDSLNELIQQVCNKNSKIYGGIVSRSIASYNKTSPKSVPIYQYFELTPSDFDTRYNKDYTYVQLGPTKTKGNRPCYPPVEWYRHSLNISKYGSDSSWIGSKNSAIEWPVVYHGTSGTAVKPITTGGFKTGSADAYGSEARANNPKVKDYTNCGVYCSPDISICENDGYVRQVTIPINNNGTSTYRVAFMCRVDPSLVTEHNQTSGKYAKNCKLYWRVMHESGIRPYGLLLKKTS
ncbi:unnamed protein product [Adineta steineri]|uniref:Farnesoic acid O-methyl transferase domain-containing protein n=1 Tax=Adineta steineri TaxID=433720 RepID=A0A819IX19_9BILA|nr:unnamed protein product [Adineta steineri]CAF1253046.1 unnamed protein product [Adineta steineri]CAF3866830.1 unnamed protein product [Adineta steineri]CAF3920965.1 unnamed protein product [Adineta steineri]